MEEKRAWEEELAEAARLRAEAAAEAGEEEEEAPEVEEKDWTPYEYAAF